MCVRSRLSFEFAPNFNRWRHKQSLINLNILCDMKINLPLDVQLIFNLAKRAPTTYVRNSTAPHGLLVSVLNTFMLEDRSNKSKDVILFFSFTDGSGPPSEDSF